MACFQDDNVPAPRYGINIMHKSTINVKSRMLILVVVVLTLTRIIKSVVTGQAPVTLELRNAPGKKIAWRGRNVPVLMLQTAMW